MTLAVKTILAALAPFRFRVGRELDLQDGVAAALAAAGVDAVRGFRLDRGPIDLYVAAGRVGVECKVDGSRAEVARQLVDYAADPLVDAIVLVTSKPSHVAGLAAEISGKPLGLVKLWGGL